MPLFPHTHAISNRAAIWKTTKNGRRPSVTPNQRQSPDRRVSECNRDFSTAGTCPTPPKTNRLHLRIGSVSQRQMGTGRIGRIENSFIPSGGVLAFNVRTTDPCPASLECGKFHRWGSAACSGCQKRESFGNAQVRFPVPSANEMQN